MSTLPKRDAPELINALRIRAKALTGQTWELSATRDMMNEAADCLEKLAGQAAGAAEGVSRLHDLEQLARDMGTVQSVLQRKRDLSPDEHGQVRMLGEWRTRVFRALDELSTVRAAGGASYRCGGARLGPDAKGCGAALVFESASKGVEYWRCPQCGNPHWFQAAGRDGGVSHDQKK